MLTSSLPVMYMYIHSGPPAFSPFVIRATLKERFCRDNIKCCHRCCSHPITLSMCDSHPFTGDPMRVQMVVSNIAPHHSLRLKEAERGPLHLLSLPLLTASHRSYSGSFKKEEDTSFRSEQFTPRPPTHHPLGSAT